MARTVEQRTAPPGLPARWSARRLVVIATLIGVAATVTALVVGGGTPQAPTVPGLPWSGAGTEWALPLARLCTDFGAICTVGLLITAGALVPSRKGRLTSTGVRLTSWATVAAVAWVLAALAQILLTLSDEIGEPLSSALDPTVLRSFVTQIAQGQSLLAQLVGAVVVAATCRFLVTPSGTGVTALVALAALIVPALTGHSGASSEHDIAVSSLMIHLIAASVWVGGLAGLIAVALIDRRVLRDVAPRFSQLALWCYVALALSGVTNAWIRLRSPADLVGTGYGRLVLAKTLLLAALGVAGWWHRQRTLPALAGARNVAPFVRLACAELALMATAVGVAVALSRTPTPVVPPSDLTGASPARLLLGFDLPPAPTPLRLLLTQVRLDPFFLAVAILMAALYVAGLRRLRQRGDRWPLGRSIPWFGGVLLVLWATNGGVGTYGQVLFSVHMVQHMVLAMVVPVLLVLGAPTTLALRVLPAGRDDPGLREWLTALLQSRVLGFFSNPVIAAPIFVASFYGLYFTSLYETLMSSHWGHVLMLSHFLLAGYLFFWSLIGIDPGPRRLPYLARLVIHFLVMPAHAFFNIAILSTTSLIAGSYFQSLHRPYRTDLLADQHLGAGIGWALGELPMLMVVVAIGVQWMRSDEREASRFDRTADRAAAAGESANDELAVYNRRLQAMHARDMREAADVREGGERATD